MWLIKQYLGSVTRITSNLQTNDDCERQQRQDRLRLLSLFTSTKRIKLTVLATNSKVVLKLGQVGQKKKITGFKINNLLVLQIKVLK